MGWDFTRNAKKQDIVNSLLTPIPKQPESEWSNSQQKSFLTGLEIERKILKSKVVDNILWTVEDVIKYDGTKVCSQNVYIACYLLEAGYGGWGYKALCESMHPYYYSCPLEFLTLAPVTCQEWRAIVQELNEKV